MAMLDYDSLYGLMSSRRSTRKFKNRPLEDGQIMKIIQAGITAPSSLNKQPWDFVVVTDKEKKKKLREIYTNSRKKQNFYEQDTVFVEYTTPIVLVSENENKDFLYSCAMAVQNMNLAAVSMGLASLQAVAATTLEEDRKAIAELFGIPKGKFVMLLLFYGYADEKPVPKPKKSAGEVAHFNGF
jgi:nitroreductase